MHQAGWLAGCLSVCLSVCLLSVCLSVCLSICLSVCLSVCFCLCFWLGPYDVGQEGWAGLGAALSEPFPRVQGISDQSCGLGTITLCSRKGLLRVGPLFCLVADSRVVGSL